MRISVEINPNLRVDGDKTVADLDEDVHGGAPVAGEWVGVFEPQSGLYGEGWVLEVDEVEREVLLGVAWGALRLPEGNSGQRSLALNAVLNGRLLVSTAP